MVRYPLGFSTVRTLTSHIRSIEPLCRRFEVELAEAVRAGSRREAFRAVSIGIDLIWTAVCADAFLCGEFFVRHGVPWG